MLKSIIATFECDNCGHEVVVDLDPATATHPAKTLCDEAELQLQYNDRGAIRDGRHLCIPCEDELYPIV